MAIPIVRNDREVKKGPICHFLSVKVALLGPHDVCIQSVPMN